MNFAPEFKVSLTDWSRIRPQSFHMSALHACRISIAKSNKFEGFVFAGSYSGAIARFYVFDNKAKARTCAYGHNAKIVQFDDCIVPIVKNCVVSLSVDGTICIWSVMDGLCIFKFENILPEGCQRIAVSKTQLDLAVVSGAFPQIFFVNLTEGNVMMKLQQQSSGFISCLSFYLTEFEEWLFMLDANGCATYLNMKFQNQNEENGSQKIRIITPKNNDLILDAKPSPDFSYLLVMCSNSFYLIDIKYQHFPFYYHETEEPISGILWVNEKKFLVVYMNGDYNFYIVKKSNSNYTHGEVVLSLIRNSNQIQAKDSIQLNSFFKEREKYLNPLSTSDKEIKNVITDDIIPDVISNQSVTQSIKSVVLPPDEGDKVSTKIHNLCITPWKDDVIFGFNDTICVATHNYEEYSLKKIGYFKKKNPVTAQCFITKNGKVDALVEGTENGEIWIRSLSEPDKEKQVLNKKHNGMVTAICSSGNHLITSGRDCLVYLFKIESSQYIEIKTFCQFSAPVVSFLHVKNIFKNRKHEKAALDMSHYIFCQTSNNVLAMIDIKNHHQCKMVMSGLDGKIKSVFYHKSTKMILVECKSLHFWSLITTNLESIVTGNNKYKFINNLDSSYIPLIPISEEAYGVKYNMISTGNLSLQLPIIDIRKISKVIHVIFKKQNELKSLDEFLKEIPNSYFIYNLLPPKIKETINIYQNPEVNFTFCFIGDKDVPTAYFPNSKIPSKYSIWNISHLISSTIYGIYLILSSSMRSYPLFDKIFNSEIRKVLKQKYTHYQVPSIFYLFLFMIASDLNAHEFINKFINSLSSTIRLEWIEKLKEASKYFTRYCGLFTLVRCYLVGTVLNKLDSKRQEDLLFSFSNLIGDIDSEQLGAFARDLIVSNISLYKEFLDANLPLKKKLILSVISNLGKNYTDENCFFILFKEFTSICLEIAQSIIKTGDISIIKMLIKQINKYYEDGEKISNEDDFRKLFEIIFSWVDIIKDDVYSFLAKINNEIPWLSFCKATNSLAYSHEIGNFTIIVKRNNKFVNKFIYDVYQLDSIKVSSINFDPSGKFIMVISDEKKIVLIFKLNIIQSDETEKIELSQVFNQPIEKNKTYKWKDKGELSISNEDTSDSSILKFD